MVNHDLVLVQMKQAAKIKEDQVRNLEESIHWLLGNQFSAQGDVGARSGCVTMTSIRRLARVKRLENGRFTASDHKFQLGRF